SSSTASPSVGRAAHAAAARPAPPGPAGNAASTSHAPPHPARARSSHSHPMPSKGGSRMSAHAPGARIEPRRRSGIPYVLIVPAVLALLLGLGYPLIWQVVTSFQKYGLAQQFGQPPQWVGFDNFANLAWN